MTSNVREILANTGVILGARLGNGMDATCYETNTKLVCLLTGEKHKAAWLKFIGLAKAVIEYEGGYAILMPRLYRLTDDQYYNSKLIAPLRNIDLSDVLDGECENRMGDDLRAFIQKYPQYACLGLDIHSGNIMRNKAGKLFLTDPLYGGHIGFRESKGGHVSVKSYSGCQCSVCKAERGQS